MCVCVCVLIGQEKESRAEGHEGQAARAEGAVKKLGSGWQWDLQTEDETLVESS